VGRAGAPEGRRGPPAAAALGAGRGLARSLRAAAAAARRASPAAPRAGNGSVPILAGRCGRSGLRGASDRAPAGAVPCRAAAARGSSSPRHGDFPSGGKPAMLLFCLFGFVVGFFRLSGSVGFCCRAVGAVRVRRVP